MSLTVSRTTTDKPKGKSGGGRNENPEWAEVAAVIKTQKPGEWVTYEEYDGTPDAIRVGLRLRQAASFKPGKAFSILGTHKNVNVALIGKKIAKVKDEKGKLVDREVATLSISYNPTKSPARKRSTTKAPAKV